jgi:UDP-glucose 4-epimerase
MQLIVTGASGFIGRNVLLRAPRDWRIVAVYHHTTDLPLFVARHELNHVTAVACDLSSEADVERLSTIVGPGASALYLAANGDPAASANRPGWDLVSNTVALVHFLEHCRAERVVYMSSGAVYDGLRGPVNPATAVNPLLPYAISKLASERYLAFFAERRARPATFVNVRFFGAYGPYEAARKITTRYLRAIHAGQRVFTIRGDGRNLIDLMYVDDAVDALLGLVRDASFSGTVDLAGGAPVTLDEVVGVMAAVTGVEVRIQHEGAVPEYIEFRSVDATMRDHFGFRPATPFADGINRLYQFLVHRADCVDHAG